MWLNDHIVDDWLDGRAYHRGRFTRTPVDNPDQRIQQDIATFTVGVARRSAVGAISSMVSLVSFTVDPVAAVRAAHGVRASRSRAR